MPTQHSIVWGVAGMARLLLLRLALAVLDGSYTDGDWVLGIRQQTFGCIPTRNGGVDGSGYAQGRPRSSPAAPE